MIAIICHGCETSLIVDITSGELLIQRCADGMERGPAPFHLIGIPAVSSTRSQREG